PRPAGRGSPPRGGPPRRHRPVAARPPPPALLPPHSGGGAVPRRLRRQRHAVWPVVLRGIHPHRPPPDRRAARLRGEERALRGGKDLRGGVAVDPPSAGVPAVPSCILQE